MSLSTLLFLAAPLFIMQQPPTVDQLDLNGTWQIIGNGTSGDLKIAIDANDQLTGRIYDQPIKGTFDRSSKRIEFVRYLNESDQQGIQRWNGVLRVIPHRRKFTYVIEGTFVSIAGPEYGATDKSYPWKGQSEKSPAPSEDMRAIQGDWVVAGITNCMQKEVKLPDDLGLNARGTLVKFDKNQIKVDNKLSAVIANDIQSDSLASQIGFASSRLMIITLPTGEALICSYSLGDESMEICYPHTTSCHRGSGHIVLLKRPTKP